MATLNLNGTSSLFSSSNLKVYDFFKMVENKGFFNDTRHKVGNTPWRGGYSNNSFSFIGNNIQFPVDLKGVFNITDRVKGALFDKQYASVIDGNTNEERRIRTLHSSALLSLLFFYGVTKENPLIMEMNGRKVFFTESKFEMKNKVFSTPSSVDVVLFGNYEGDSKGKSVVLFLESKFSEYLISGKCVNISDSYKSIYKKIEEKVDDNWNLQFTYSGGGAITIEQKGGGRCNHYCGGIKQMISHFMGVQSYVQTQPQEEDVFLGEVLFDFSGKCSQLSGFIADYSSLYQGLSKALNKLPQSGFFVLPGIITYQDIIKCNSSYDLDAEVREFYLF